MALVPARECAECREPEKICDIDEAAFVAFEVVFRELASHLVDSCEETECFARKFANDFTDAAALPNLSDQELAYVVHEYVASDRQIEVLLRAVVQTPTFLQ